MVRTYLARRDRLWHRLPAEEIERVIRLLEDNLVEEPARDANLRLWFQAIKCSARPPALESVIERIAYWHGAADTLDSSYYLYIIHALQAMAGSTLGRETAMRFIDECKWKSRYRRNRTMSFEWIGGGEGVARLTHQSELGEWNPDGQFWTNTGKLSRVSGLIARVESPQAGRIETAGGLNAFFVPGRSQHERGRSENQPVTFFLGFSYDGLRAWQVEDS